ncbi:hypothetical protein JDV02_002168 [Purpureocillium takamizusanense]|uniref:FAD dependent oxidoreductase domain-containing protein n=1 Tax=Purpureocillium takamizusanense TaxID=2060973 RepID=A0A9Q8QAD8_9HYPO|nr:uncharacterized protein JDV02_002168 [Purpureocillium takamizusanense]UNI15657.1 hypothetical protein JDV02_002168 [Purpureocillium takamizusanense]
MPYTNTGIWSHTSLLKMNGIPFQHGRSGLPTHHSTDSYWHRDPSKKLWGHQTTKSLPPTADVVVIGSGITGTFAARELVAGGREVVMLEAREACWGATGRNGGHCHPGVWNNSPEVARFELATFDLIKALVAKYDIPCDWQVVGSLQPIFDPEVLRVAQRRIKRLQAHRDLRDKAVLILDKDELVSRRVPEAIAAVYHPNAAKCWPYKLVAWLLEQLLNEHCATAFNLQTNTPVTMLHRRGAGWLVHTDRGTICARDVLLASNAYTSYLLPKLTGLIVPMRGQVCAFDPPRPSRPLPHSYLWIKDSNQQYLTHHYLIQRGHEGAQKSDGVDDEIIFGIDLAAPTGDEGVSRDDEVNPILSQLLRSSLRRAVQLPTGPEAGKDALRTAYEWTGIMGYSLDGNPWVGAVPGVLVTDLEPGDEADGLWISAGYTGHGMPVAARCGIAVAQMMLGKEGGVKVPEPWAASEERVRSAREMKFPRTVEDMAKSLATDDA